MLLAVEQGVLRMVLRGVVSSAVPVWGELIVIHHRRLCGGVVNRDPVAEGVIQGGAVEVIN